MEPQISRDAFLTAAENGPEAKIFRAVELLRDALTQLDGRSLSDPCISPPALKSAQGTSTESGFVSERTPTVAREQPTGRYDDDAFTATRSENIILLPTWRHFDESRLRKSYELKQVTTQHSSANSLMKRTASSLSLLALASRTWTIHPKSKVRKGWDILSFLFVIWDLTVIPLYAFDFGQSQRRFLSLSDWVIAAFWSVDIFMSSRTGFYTNTSVELRTKQVALHYATGWMLVDLPITTLEWMTCTGFFPWRKNPGRFTRIRMLFRCSRIFRGLKLLLFANKFDKPLRSSYVDLCFSIFKFLCCFAFICHFLTCGWYAIGESDPKDGWTSRMEATDRTGFVHTYLTAFLWIMSQMNGNVDEVGENKREKIYSAFCAFFQMVLNTLCISVLTTKMVELDSIMADKLKGVRLLDVYANRHRITYSTFHFALKFVQHHQKIKTDEKIESSLLELLPEHLQWDILYEVRTPTLSHHAFMDDLAFNFTPSYRQLVGKAMLPVYTRVDEVIFEPGIPCARVLFNVEGDIYYTPAENYSNHLQEVAVSARRNFHGGFFDGIQDTISGIKLAGSKKISRGIRAGANTSVWASTIDASCMLAVPRNACLSEAAFWIKWRHRGALLATTDSSLLAVNLDTLFSVLAYHSGAEARAAMYAFSFNEKMINTEIHDLMDSDFGQLIPDFLEKVLSPVNVEAPSGSPNGGLFSL